MAHGSFPPSTRTVGQSEDKNDERFRVHVTILCVCNVLLGLNDRLAHTIEKLNILDLTVSIYKFFPDDYNSWQDVIFSYKYLMALRPKKQNSRHQITTYLPELFTSKQIRSESLFNLLHYVGNLGSDWKLVSSAEQFSLAFRDPASWFTFKYDAMVG